MIYFVHCCIHRVVDGSFILSNDFGTCLNPKHFVRWVKISADNILIYYFSLKIGFNGDNLHELLNPKESLHEMLNPIFKEKK